jgi:hypothetical protein
MLHRRYIPTKSQLSQGLANGDFLPFVPETLELLADHGSLADKDEKGIVFSDDDDDEGDNEMDPSTLPNVSEDDSKLGLWFVFP